MTELRRNGRGDRVRIEVEIPGQLGHLTELGRNRRGDRVRIEVEVRGHLGPSWVGIDEEIEFE